MIKLNFLEKITYRQQSVPPKGCLIPMKICVFMALLFSNMFALSPMHYRQEYYFFGIDSFLIDDASFFDFERRDYYRSAIPSCFIISPLFLLPSNNPNRQKIRTTKKTIFFITLHNFLY